MLMYDWKVKVLLLGGETSGKEDFCSKFTLGFSHQFKKFMGVDIFVKDLKIGKDEKLSLSFWNLTKNKYLDLLLPNFIKGADISFIWFNLASKESFQEAKEWIRLIRKKLEDLPIVLLGNLDDLNLEREIDRNSVKKLITKYNIPIYIETCVNNNINIKDALNLIGEILVDAKLKKQKINFQELNPHIKERFEDLASLKH